MIIYIYIYLFILFITNIMYGIASGRPPAEAEVAEAHVAVVGLVILYV